MMIGNGSELPRIALIIPWMVLGGICCSAHKESRTAVWTLLGIGGVSGYLVLRGGMSPVWDLARRDLFVIVSGVLAYVSASSALQWRAGRGLFLGALAFMILGNAVLAFAQLRIDGGISFLREARVDQLGVSGFYYHRNYLAGFLEIAFPVLVAASLSRKSWFSMLHLAGWAIGCAVLCFLTNSRGGFGVMVIGGLISFILELSRLAKEKRLVLSNRNKILIVVSLIVGCGLIVGGGYYFSRQILAHRGGAGAAIGAMGGRLGMAGIAMDIWLQSPFFGMGAESYSYLFPKYFEGIYIWSGDAEMAHSDYLQLLSDYGIVGLLSVTCLIVGVAFQLSRKNVEDGSPELLAFAGGFWLKSAAAGALVAEVLRATFDFNLHLSSNLMLLAIVIAGGVNSRNDRLLGESAEEMSSNKRKRGGGSKLIAISLVLGMGGIALWAGRREIMQVCNWIEVEKMRFRGEDTAEALRSFSEKAPSFGVLRDVARRSLATAATERSDSFVQTSNDWMRVVKRHPFDGESLANYARCLDEGKEFGSAETIHARALEAVSRRENKYGVIFGVGWHFVKRAEDALSKRQSGRALFLYHEADACFRESYLRNFKRTTSNREAADWVRGRIDFLEGARIEPVEVPVLDWRAHIE